MTAHEREVCQFETGRLRRSIDINKAVEAERYPSLTEEEQGIRNRYAKVSQSSDAWQTKRILKQKKSDYDEGSA